MLDKFQDMGKLLKQAQELRTSMKKIQQELKQTKISMSAMDGGIKVVVNGELEVLLFEVAEELFEKKNHKRVEKATKDCFAKAIKKAKDLATSKLSSASGGFLPEN